jgi:hypothetical protein
MCGLVGIAGQQPEFDGLIPQHHHAHDRGSSPANYRSASRSIPIERSIVASRTKMRWKRR